jgi:PKD repeat protein
MRTQKSPLQLLLIICFIIAGISQNTLQAKTMIMLPPPDECPQPTLQMSETGEPGKYKFTIHSDKPFTNLSWVVTNFANWSYSSGTQWQYSGTHAEITLQLPFNGQFRVSFRLQYPLAITNPAQYCNIQYVFRDNVTASGMPACTAAIKSTIKSKATYEFGYVGTSFGSYSGGTLLWEFGDGTTSTQAQPTHIYTQDGTYTVRLTGQTANGCSIESYHTLNVGCENIQARITDKNTGPGPGGYSLDIDVPETVKNYTVNYGDGKYQPLPSLDHKYDYNGTYNVKYTATTIGGCTVTARDTVTITNAHLCGTATLQIAETGEVGRFNYTVQATKPMLSVQMVIAGIDRPWHYQPLQSWPNHTRSTHTYKIPANGPARVYFNTSYEYAPGKYCYFDMRDTVEVYGYPCTAAITATPSYMDEATYKFSLSNTSTNIGIAGKGTTLWEFGDGTTSTQFEPTHAYQQSGTYTVKVTRTYYGCTATATRTITLCRSGEVPIQIQSTPTPGNYKFAIASGDPIIEAYWSIDSDHTGTGEVHWFEWYNGLNTLKHEIPFQFTTNGTYSIWGFVFTQNGCYLEAYRNVEITSFPTDPSCQGLSASIHTTRVSAGQYTFTVETNAVFQNYEWDFGDDSENSTQPSPTHQYTENGVYQITFTGSTANGCIVTTYHNITITDICNITPVISTTKTGPGQYTFAILPSGLQNGFIWNFGNGKTSSQLNPSYQYDKKGTYQITFTGTTTEGCPVAATHTLEVTDACDIEHTIKATRTNTGLYTFTLEPAANMQSGFTWNFGDTKTSTQLNPSHTYVNNGTYQITFTGNTAQGCPIAATYTLEVTDVCNAQHVIKAVKTNTGVYTFTLEPVVNMQSGFIWNFGNTETSTQLNPTHAYTKNGTYQVTFTGNTVQGCPISVQHSLTITDIVENLPYNISGKVQADKNLVTDGIVILYEQKFGTWSAINYGVISNGEYIINQVPKGNYLLYALPNLEKYSNYLPTYYINAFTWNQAQEVKVNETVANATINLIGLNSTTKGNGKISGSITIDEDAYEKDIFGRVGSNSLGRTTASKVANIPVYLTDNTGKIIAWTLTDEDGNYTFENLPTGSFKVSVQKPSTQGGESSTVSLSQGKPEAVVEKLEITKAGRVTGTTKNENGEALFAYPNPSKGNIQFSKRVSGAIYDVTGSLILKLDNTTTANLSAVEKGIYLLKTDTGEIVKIMID